MQSNVSFNSLSLLPSSINSLLYCKQYQNLNPNHKPDDQLNGSFRITTYYKDPGAWFSCDKNIVLPELISRYLHLNLSFVKPNDDLNETWGWYNGIHSSGILEMLVNDQADYIINDIYMNETLWHPNGMIAMTTALDDNYKINFLTKKYKNIKKFGNYDSEFDWLAWLIIIILVSIISAILCLNLMIKRSNEKMKFPWKLYFDLIIDNMSLLLSKHPSVVLSKLIPRQFLMVAIPLLSILTINLINSSHYSYTINPYRKWCDSLDCFANQKRYQFYQLENRFTMELMKDSKEFNDILNRTEIQKKKGKFDDNLINLIIIKILITVTIKFEKFFDVLKGRRIFVGKSNHCEMILNYLKTVNDISNWIIAVSKYYEYEIKIVNMKHPKYKRIIKLINLTNEHGILKQKINRFKIGVMLLSNWLELIEPEMVNKIKQELDQNTNQIKFDELIYIFVINIIESVAIIMIFLIELIYFFLNHYFNSH